MDIIKIKDKKFAISIREADIQREVARVAADINRDLAGKNPLFISVLNGAFMFTADLMKHLTLPCEVSFVKLESYSGLVSAGKVKQLIGLKENISGRTIVIVEDVVDSGITMKKLLDDLQEYNPKEIYIAALLVKPDSLKVELDIKYVGMRIPNDFIVGYGMDYDGQGRNYPDMYIVAE